MLTAHDDNILEIPVFHGLQVANLAWSINNSHAIRTSCPRAWLRRQRLGGCGWPHTIVFSSIMSSDVFWCETQSIIAVVNMAAVCCTQTRTWRVKYAGCHYAQDVFCSRCERAVQSFMFSIRMNCTLRCRFFIILYENLWRVTPLVAEFGIRAILLMPH